MTKAGWNKRIPSMPGAFWRRRLCGCGGGWLPPEIVHLVKSKRTAGMLSELNPAGMVIIEDPAAQWIQLPAVLPPHA